MGSRAPWAASHEPASEASSASRTVGPSYQGERSVRSTTLSPSSAETGMASVEVKPSSCETVSISSTTRW